MYTDEGYWLPRLLLQRGLGLVYLMGFLCVVNQFRPLCGERGLLPAPLFMERVRFRDRPSIFYRFPNDRAFLLFGWFGVTLSLLALTGLSERFGTGLSLAVWALLWLIYLSYVNIGQTFYAFGWESMLLECGFLAIFLGPADTQPHGIVIWLFRWVLFRVMFGAGMIKWRGDPCWRDLTCLDYHNETQPMPNPLSWYFHWLPAVVRKGGVAFNHVVELGVPFLYFAPQPVAAIAGLLTILFQGVLIVSGNFSWLNWLTLVLAFSTFSDLPELALAPPVPAAGLPAVVTWCLALFVTWRSIDPVRNLFSPDQIMNTSYDSLHLVNTYGAFGSITKVRFEIVLEGTDEAVITPGTRWREYEFKGKPGDPCRLPPQIAPYHLRLDWLMWFEAMSRRYYSSWFIHLLAKLLEGDRGVLGLLRTNPFPDAPPRHVRALHYIYRFTTGEERKRTGCWWHRDLAGIYFHPVGKDDPLVRRLVGSLRD